jgi:multidrug resistance efflux pump
VRVKKEQPLVRLDDDEPKADLRLKQAVLKELEANLERLKAEPRQHEQDEAKASLDAARASAQEARRFLTRITQLWSEGAVSEQRHHEAAANLLKTEAEERAAAARVQRLVKRPFQHEVGELKARIAAAAAAVDAAKAELEHYTVVAPIEGRVATLDVNRGTVSRPGTWTCARSTRAATCCRRSWRE